MVVLPFDGAVMGCFFKFKLESVAGCVDLCGLLKSHSKWFAGNFEQAVPSCFSGLGFETFAGCVAKRSGT